MGWSKYDENMFNTAIWHISNSVSNGKSKAYRCEATEWLSNIRKKMRYQSTFDYDALLLAAKTRWAELNNSVASCISSSERNPALAPETQAKIRLLQDEHLAWLKRNIDDKDLIMETNAYTGEPLSLSIVLATSCEIKDKHKKEEAPNV